MMIISESVPASVEVFHFDVFFYRFLGLGTIVEWENFPFRAKILEFFMSFPIFVFLRVPPFDVLVFQYPIIM